MKNWLKNRKRLMKTLMIVCGSAVALLFLLAITCWLWPPRAKNFSQIAPAYTNAADQILPINQISASDHIFGNIKAKAQIIVYDDFECPFCLQFNNVLQQVRKEYPDQAVIAIRHFPLQTHSNALLAAQALECADEQGKWSQMYDLLWRDQKAQKLTLDQFTADAHQLSLDSRGFQDCLTSERFKAKVMAQKAQAKTFGVVGTPTIFINGQILPGAYQWADFKDQTGQTREGLKKLIDNVIKQ